MRKKLCVMMMCVLIAMIPANSAVAVVDSGVLCTVDRDGWVSATRTKGGDRYDLSQYEYLPVVEKGRGALIFQKSPRGSFMTKHKFHDGDWIYVNVNWRDDGYAIAYEDGEYGYVDASYIDWNYSAPPEPEPQPKDDGRYDLNQYEYFPVVEKGRGALIFQKSPRGSFMRKHKFYDGDWIYVNVDWRDDGYAIAYEDGDYGYVDASYIDWYYSAPPEPEPKPKDDIRYDLDQFDYRPVVEKGRGALIFQKSPRGSFMTNHKFHDGDWIFVNLNWREDGYAIAYEDGEFGYVDASYIDWR